jgi:hypothetical protein
MPLPAMKEVENGFVARHVGFQRDRLFGLLARQAGWQPFGLLRWPQTQASISGKAAGSVMAAHHIYRITPAPIMPAFRGWHGGRGGLPSPLNSIGTPRFSYQYGPFSLGDRRSVRRVGLGHRWHLINGGVGHRMQFGSVAGGCRETKIRRRMNTADSGGRLAPRNSPTGLESLWQSLSAGPATAASGTGGRPLQNPRVLMWPA